MTNTVELHGQGGSGSSAVGRLSGTWPADNGTALYRHNGFRVLQLPVTADATAIEARAGKLLQGMTVPLFALALEPQPARDAVKEAAERLHDPELRWLDELFWLWPTRSEPALTSKGMGWERDDPTVAHWTRAAADGDAIARHNLAVLHHAVALDFSHHRQYPDPALLERAWEAAVCHWSELGGDDAFWGFLAERAAALGLDASTDRAQAARTMLPHLLAQQLAEACVAAAKGGRQELCAAYRRLCAHAGLAEEGVRAALHAQLGPDVDQLNAMASRAVMEVRAAPDAADDIIERLLVRAEPMLAMIDRALGGGHPWRDYAYDDVARSVQTCVEMAAGEHTRRRLDLLGRAAGHVCDPALRRDLGSTLGRIARQVDAHTGAEPAQPRSPSAPPAGAAGASTCFYCRRAAVSESSFHDVWTAERRGQKQRVTVPRCFTCAQRAQAGGWQAPSAVLGAAAAALVGALGLVPLPNVAPRSMPMALGAMAALGAGIGLLVGAWRRGRRDTRQRMATGEFPELRELAATGWSLAPPPASAAPMIAAYVIAIACLALGVGLGLYQLGSWAGQG